MVFHVAAVSDSTRFDNLIPVFVSANNKRLPHDSRTWMKRNSVNIYKQSADTLMPRKKKEARRLEREHFRHQQKQIREGKLREIYNFRTSWCFAIWWTEQYTKRRVEFLSNAKVYLRISFGVCSDKSKMFCPANETIQQLTEKTKLLAQKCSQQMRVTSTSADVSDSSTFDSPKQQQVATFRSYIAEAETGGESARIDFPVDSPSAISCLTVNLASLNRIIKNRCSFVSTTSYTFGTFPRKKQKRATAKWFIKVSL